MLKLPLDIINFFLQNPAINQEEFCVMAIRDKINSTLFNNDVSINNSNSVIKIFTDGGSRGNPGISGAGWVLKQDNKILYTGKKYLGIITNNQAEYFALILGLKSVKNFSFSSLEIYMDSELIVKQIKGEYKVKDLKLQKLFEQVQSLLPTNYSIYHINRELNLIADKLANEAMNKGE